MKSHLAIIISWQLQIYCQWSSILSCMIAWMVYDIIAHHCLTTVLAMGNIVSLLYYNMVLGGTSIEVSYICYQCILLIHIITMTIIIVSQDHVSGQTGCQNCRIGSVARISTDPTRLFWQPDWPQTCSWFYLMLYFNYSILSVYTLL